LSPILTIVVRVFVPCSNGFLIKAQNSMNKQEIRVELAQRAHIVVLFVCEKFTVREITFSN